MHYLEIHEKAKLCEFQYQTMCTKRKGYRDCLRAMCCGVCPTNDTCEGLCSKITEKEESNG